jgi:hypothetical protein
VGAGENRRSESKTAADQRGFARINRKRSAQIRGPLRFVSQPGAAGHSPAQGAAGKDMGREYFVPGFSVWKDHDAYRVAFGRLLSNLKAEERQR